MIQIDSLIFNPFSVNSYIIHDQTNECIIVDPGCRTEEEENILINFIESKKLKPVKLINTHNHLDHVAGNAFVKHKWSIPIYAHSKDLSNLNDAEKAGTIYGMPIKTPPYPDVDLKGKTSINFGDSSLDIWHLPGHSEGSIGLIAKQEKFAVVGDVLFRGSIGRTDLNGGSLDELMNSIKKQLFKLDDEFVIYSGHGPYTTIEEEKRTNPFLLDNFM